MILVLEKKSSVIQIRHFHHASSKEGLNAQSLEVSEWRDLFCSSRSAQQCSPLDFSVFKQG